MGKYMLKCRLCNTYFTSYESYERHVVEQHQDNLAYRFRPMIVRWEEDEGT
ncbi:MAG: hypothetical protein ACK4FV_05105 [Candidatus Nitrosocaldus sp.]